MPSQQVLEEKIGEVEEIKNLLKGYKSIGIASLQKVRAPQLQELKKTPYDLLITDLRMPEMSGLELLRHVREVSPATQTILVTAYGTKDVWEEARRQRQQRLRSNFFSGWVWSSP